MTKPQESLALPGVSSFCTVFFIGIYCESYGQPKETKPTLGLGLTLMTGDTADISRDIIKKEEAQSNLLLYLFLVAAFKMRPI